MDEIRIKALKIYGYHGVFDFEKKEGQYFYVNAILKLNTQSAGIDDDLTLSVSYADVCTDIEKLLTENIYNLIETAAERVASMILDRYSLVQYVTVEICKPDAPVSQEVENLSVCITRGRHQVFIAYGSNMGDSKVTISSAIAMIDENPYCKVVNQSTMVISSPYGGVEQSDFYNGVIEIETYYEPENLLDELQKIELVHGRKREVHWGPRTLDLDIILYDNLVINNRRLTVPHPDMCNRDFVLKPLAEIAGYIMHPIKNIRICDMADSLKENYIK